MSLFTSLCRWRGSWLLLALVPGALVAVLYVHVTTVDLYWLYSAGWKLSDTLALTMASHGTAWQVAKQGFWPIVFLGIEMIFLVILCSLTALLIAPSQTSTLAKAALWSKSPVFLMCFVILIARGLVEKPARVLTSDFNPLSWNSLLSLEGAGALQIYSTFQSPLTFLSVAILAFAFKQFGRVSWPAAFAWGALPYALFNAISFYIWGVFFR